MPIPPKKLKAFVDEDKKKSKQAPPEDDDESIEGDEPEGQEEGGEGGEPEDAHISEEETAALLEKAENEVANGPDGALMSALAGYEGTGEPPPGFDEAIWEAACEIVGPEDYQGDGDPWLVAAHVYKHLGGEVAEAGGEGEEEQPQEPEGGGKPPPPQFGKGVGKPGGKPNFGGKGGGKPNFGGGGKPPQFNKGGGKFGKG